MKESLGQDHIARKRLELSVVVPCYNEAVNIRPLIERIVAVTSKCVSSAEILFINDGSIDDTLAVIGDLATSYKQLRCVSLSRNFGKEVAIAAGLDYCSGDAVVIIDADLQQPPELIANFVEHWRDGYKNVYGRRIDRDTDSWVRRAVSRGFYRVFSFFADVDIPDGSGDFRLLDRQAVDALKLIREHARFSKGLYSWIGFKTIDVPFRYQRRFDGKSKYNIRSLLSLALTGLMSFSSAPLRLWLLLGALISFVSITLGLVYLVRTIIFGIDVPGYASIIVSITMLSGFQLLSLGVLGEYLAKTFTEAKRRPLYIVDELISADALSASSIVTD